MKCEGSDPDTVKVSIIIPVYNCEIYLDKCINSVCAQTYKNIQIIVIDDGSSDGSSSILDEFNDDRLVVIHQENAGVCAARNNGLERADGEFITFIDGDDYIEPDYIMKMVKCAMENESELVISGFLYETTDGQIKNTIIPLSYVRGYDEMWAYRLSSACGRLYSKEFWDKNALSFTLQKGVRGEDVPICLFANYAAVNITTIKYAGYHYIQHAGSATHEYIGMKKYGFPYDAMDELAEKVKDLEEHNSREFYEVGILKLFAQFYYYMGCGADNRVKHEMLSRFRNYVYNNCPNFRRSWRDVKKQSKLPVVLRGAIELFVRKMMRLNQG